MDKSFGTSSLLICVLSLILLKNIYSQVTDADGNTYEVVIIGTQVWMAENLNTGRFRNGEIIPQVRNNKEWRKAIRRGNPAWAYYQNSLANGKKYGRIYNWHAVNDSRGLAPEGWFISSDEDWDILISYLDSLDIAAIALKSATGWAENGSGNNTSGFNALPGGYRYFNGDFFGAGHFAYWWSLTPLRRYFFWGRIISYNNNVVQRLGLSIMNGYYVRCVIDKDKYYKK